jgi:MYXO-CTERM domain-containing protein
MSIIRINALIINGSTQAQNDTTVVLEDPSNTNWLGILLLIVLALFAAWLRRKLR